MAPFVLPRAKREPNSRSSSNCIQPHILEVSMLPSDAKYVNSTAQLTPFRPLLQHRRATRYDPYKLIRYQGAMADEVPRMQNITIRL